MKNWSEGAYYDEKAGLLVFDLFPRNAIQAADGHIYPIDPVIQRISRRSLGSFCERSLTPSSTAVSEPLYSSKIRGRQEQSSPGTVRIHLRVSGGQPRPSDRDIGHPAGIPLGRGFALPGRPDDRQRSAAAGARQFVEAFSPLSES